MKPQNLEDLLKLTDAPEAMKALDLFELLRPGLRIKKGRIETTYGDKTVLGLYRSVKRIMEGK